MLYWWVIGAAPVLLAGYESPSHVYLASAAWAFVLGLFVEAIALTTRISHGAAFRAVPLILGTRIASTYLVRLHTEPRDYEQHKETGRQVLRASQTGIVAYGLPIEWIVKRLQVDRRG